MIKSKPWMGSLALLLIAGSVSATEIYVWTDAHGVTHFGDRPPSQTHAERVVVEAPNIIDAYEAPRRSARAGGRNRNSARERSRSVAGTNPHQRARYAEQCHKAKQQLRLIRAKKRAGYRASEERSLDAREARYRADIRFYCDD